jgi:pimeloyl-ACP methyl ester carboxylesterase
MFILEIFVFLITVVSLFLVMSNKIINKPLFISLFGLIVVAFGLHLILAGFKWQLLLLYIAIDSLIIFGYFIKIKEVSVKKRILKIVTILSSIFIVLSGLFAFSFPKYQMPEASGDYLIGTTTFIVSDDRPEIYTEDPLDTRRIKLQVWYPAETVEGYEQVPWLLDGKTISRALSKDFGFPAFALNETAKVLSNSYLDAPISSDSDQYPIVIISHGWRGFRNLHTDFAEELASLGYIVVAIDHTYGSVATLFEEGDVAYLNKEALPSRESTPDFLDYAKDLVSTYGEDVISTIDYLEVLNSDSELSDFKGRLDLTKIGVIGHSTGGGGDVYAALKDDRITALIGLDAWVESIDSTDISDGLDIPSLFLRSGDWETGENNDNLYALIDSSVGTAWLYQIDGTTHFDFSMVYMFSSLTKLVGFSGSVDSKDLNLMLEEVIYNFFDETLRGNTSSNISPDYFDEIRFIRSNQYLL